MARRLRSRHYGGSLALLVAAATAATALDASLSPVAASLTAACWVKGTAQTTTTEVLELVNATSADGLSISISSGSLVAKVRGGTAASVAASVVLNGSWHRVTASCDASTKTIVLYVDGVQVTTSGAAAWSGSFAATCKLVLGLGSIGNSALTTQDDAVLDIGHAWTAADVAADYYDATPPATYTHRWPLDDGAGTTARATRGGLALTLSGGAAFAADSPMIGRGVVRNFVAQSDDASGAAWSNSGGVVAISAYAGLLPIGPLLAKTITDALGGPSTHNLSTAAASAPALVPGRTYIASAFVKYVAGTGWVFFGGSGGAAAAGKYFNANTGAVGTTGGASSPNAEPRENGWTRIWHTFVQPAVAQGISLYLGTADGTLSYTANGQSIAATGFMIEEAYPGQTTPSPYVATGAAPLSVYGAREWRQNLLVQASAFGNAAWTKDAGAVVTDNQVANPINGAIDADLLDLTGAAGGTGIYQTALTAGIPKGAPKAHLVWARSVSGTGTLLLSDSSTVTGTTTATLTTAWTPIFLTEPQTRSDGKSGVYIRKGTLAQVYIWRAQLAQTNQVPDGIDTTTAPANSSGAPRSIAA